MKLRRLLGLLLLLLLPVLIIIMNYETKLETFYWPESSYGELFKYEYIAEVYYEHSKDYRIEIKNKDGVIEKLRIVEDMNIPKGREDQIDMLNKFYQRHKESDIFNHDIVSFKYGERYMGQHDSLVMGLVITVNCKELDPEKHKNLIDFLGFQDLLDSNLLPYDLYKEKLLKMGFEVYK